MKAAAPRTCTKIRFDDPQARQGASRPLEDFRDVHAYVLLGDPGAGKTTAFKSECDALGDRACLVTARNFLTLYESRHPEWRDKILFIDGLDELRVGESNPVAPFDRIRQYLDRLRPPALRLSCRTADWLGSNDQNHLEEVVTGGKVTVLSLDKLSDANIRQILEASGSTAIDFQNFIKEAKQQGIEELLRNPLILQMFAETVTSSGCWPQSRLEIFERACLQMAQEHNEEHSLVETLQDPSALLDTAGHLCAIQLISGISGYTQYTSQATADWPAISQCSGNVQQVEQAAKTKLFTNLGGRIAPLHRHLAEFIGARYLSRIISGLPVRRVLSLMAGEDGLVVTPLRGLAAWLAAHNGQARTSLIKLDPVGIGQYGDLSAFSNEDLRALLESLRLNNPLPGMPRSGVAFGALASPHMEPEIKRILTAPSRGDRDQEFASFVLSFLPHGQALPDLCETLYGIIRDPTRWSGARTLALDAFIHCAGPERSNEKLIALLSDIRRGTVSDPDFQLLGTLLAELYPENLSFPEVFDYLTPGGNSSLICGRYTRFWETNLCDKTPDHQIPDLLDSFVGKFDALRPALEAHCLWDLPANLLARTLQIHGDQLDAKRLYGWLGMDLPAGPRDPEPYDFTRSWLKQRPDLQKALVREGLRRHSDSEAFEIHWALGQRFHDSEMPSDFGLWCLKEALSTAPLGSPVERYLLEQAVRAQRNQVGDTGLSREILEEYAVTNSTLKQIMAPPASEQTLPSSEWKVPDPAEDKLLVHVRANEIELRENRASPNLLFHLAHVYFDHFFSEKEGNPHTIRERFPGDPSLADSVLQGLRQVVERKDIPSVDEILDLMKADKVSLFGMPFLAALAEAERTKPEGPAQWSENRIRKALLFYYTTPHGIYRPRWYENLLVTQPEAVADMQVRSAIPELRAGREHIYNLWEMAHDKAHAKVARQACLPLLRAFPIRCKKAQLNLLGHLLWAAIQHAEEGSFLNLIKKKASQASTTIAQRVYWLAAGSIVAPEEYRGSLQDFVLDKPNRIQHLAEFLHRDDSLVIDSKRWSTPVSELVVRLIGRHVAASLMFTGEGGLVTAQMVASDLVCRHIQKLADTPTHHASKILGKLLDDPDLLAWRNMLIQASEEQRIRYRDAKYLPPSIGQICQTLDGATPANAGDLWALLTDRLDEIGKQISRDRTDGWRQCWNEDAHRRPTSPKHEDSCRDAILGNLDTRLPQGVDSQPEGQYSRDKRADIRVSYQGFNVPIEIKKNNHTKLWSSAKNQLIKKYVIDPGTDGYGIYLVLWFGKDQTQPPASGPRPADPESLKQQLNATLSESEARKIAICVIDVSKESSHAMKFNLSRAETHVTR